MKCESTIISLFDYSGNWSRPYRENNYNVIQVDLKLGIDIMTWDYTYLKDIYGILAAIPCTDFSLSGARWFKEKDTNGQTEKSIGLVKKTLEIIKYFDPIFWSIENPMTRIHKLVPEVGEVQFKFHPFEFAGYDPVPRESQYRKMTWLFGKFNFPVKKSLPDIDGTKHWLKLGGKSERTKELRSTTPLGFAYAFYEANNGL
jgi:hypothetical protein